VLHPRLCRADEVVASKSMESRGKEFFKRRRCAGKV